MNSLFCNVAKTAEAHLTGPQSDCMLNPKIKQQLKCYYNNTPVSLDKCVPLYPEKLTEYIQYNPSASTMTETIDCSSNFNKCNTELTMEYSHLNS